MQAQPLCFQMDTHSHVHILKDISHLFKLPIFSQNYPNAEFAV